jgi:VWFA-related protein
MLMTKPHLKFLRILLIINILFVVTNSYAQENIIKVNTDLITIPVTVLDRQGRYISNLEGDNFQIFENGKEEKLSFLESTNQPITVFLLLDVSGSMTKHLYELANASSTFVKQLRSNDQIIAASFADRVKIFVEKTKINELRREIKINKHYRESQTRLYDAVEYSLKKMKKIEGRKAIVIFSDGFGNGIFASADDNIEDAEEGESMIYTVQFDTSSKTPSPYVSKKKFYERIDKRNDYMQTLPKVTGGRRYELKNISDLERTFKQIANELSQQYHLGYYPENPGKKGERREIKVKVNVPNVAVRARKSYIVGSNKK